MTTTKERARGMSDETESFEPAPQAELVSDGGNGITPRTRRAIIYSLGVIALTAIVAEVVIVLFGNTASDALLTVAATAVGGLAGLAMPNAGD